MERKNILPTLAILGVMAAIVINPTLYIESARKGAVLFVMNVLPALFPFFFFSRLLSVFQADLAMGNLLRSPISRLYNAPASSGYILIMSLMCGYPVGAKLISEYHTQGVLTSGECRTLASFTSTSGPLFILGTIGSIILKNSKAGIIILLSHYMSALINGLFYKAKFKPVEHYSPPLSKSGLSDSIYNSVIAILIVGGYIIVFNIVCDAVIHTGILTFIASASQPNIGELLTGIILSFIEMTRGSFIIGGSGNSIVITTATICSAITFGGLSITMQSITFLQSTGIKTGAFLIMKCTQTIIAFFLALAAALLFL